MPICTARPTTQYAQLKATDKASIHHNFYQRKTFDGRINHLDLSSDPPTPARPVRASLASSFFMSLFAWRRSFLDLAVRGEDFSFSLQKFIH